MNAGLGRRRFAVSGVVLALSLWAGAPWIFCSETWAIGQESPCTQESMAPTKVRSLSDTAPPLAPLVV
jgi:hypothetical protein